mgnify:FL=1
MHRIKFIIFLLVSITFVLAETRVTVYNNNFAIVRIDREIKLENGKTSFKIEGVSAKIDPTSVHLNFNKANQIEILEMNFLYDLVNSTKIFKKYTGSNILYHLNDGTELEGKLLNYSGGDLIVEEPDGEIRINSAKHIRDYKFPGLPGGLITKPTLKWKINSAVSGTREAELSYLTNGMNWHAEYVLVLAKNDKEFKLSSWISLENNSGASYENANLKLIAGDVHRAAEPREPRQIMLSRKAQQEDVEQREIFDYHLYEISRRVDINDREIKQVSLFDNIQGQTDKKYIFKNSAYSNSNEASLLIKLFIPNTEENNMGFPIPKGKVRMFKKDIDGSLQLIGEDRIDHTGKKDLIKLTAGKAFDVKGKRNIMDREEYKQEEVVEVKIELFNRTDNAADIEVQEIHRGDWHIKNSSSDYEKKSNNLLVFPVVLKANQKKTIEYQFVREY